MEPSQAATLNNRKIDYVSVSLIVCRQSLRTKEENSIHTQSLSLPFDMNNKFTYFLL